MNIPMLDTPTRQKAFWTVERGHSPIIATAIHDGHAVRPELASLYALSAAERLREEDPFTGFMIGDVCNQIVVHRSRFEVDLNRAREQSVYRLPEQAWGLNVWKEALPAPCASISLDLHDDYYDMLAGVLRGMERRHPSFVVLDVHSYNHRRHGPDEAATEPDMAPDINIGTFSMDRARWEHVVTPLIDHFRSFRINGRPLDVRENISFQGKGEQTRFIHEHFPHTGCAIAIEFKKFFMDEWTGEPDMPAIKSLRHILGSSVPILERALKRDP